MIRKNIFPTIFLFCFAAIIMFPILSKKQFISGIDFSFHINRIEEIYMNFKQGNFFIFLSTYNFKSVGSGVFLFYPYIFLIPFAILRFLFLPVQAFILGKTLFYLLTLMISYFSCLIFSKNRLQSLLFAIIYSSTPYYFNLGFIGNVLGEYFAYTFLPLVFLGFYEIFYGNQRRWYILSIGISLLLYCHIVSVILSCFILLLILIISNLIKITLTRNMILVLAKSILLTLFLSSFIFIPFITDYFRKGIFVPNEGVWDMPKLFDIISRSFNNDPGISFGVLLIITIFFGLFFCKKKAKLNFIYFVSLILIFLMSDFFPWQCVADINSKLVFFQSPIRFISYISLLLSLFSSEVIARLINSSKKVILIFLCLFTLQFTMVYKQAYSWYHPEEDIGILNKQNKSNLDSVPCQYLVTNDTYDNQFNYKIFMGSTDYFPLKSLNYADSFFKHIVYFEKTGEKIIFPKTFPNVIKFKIFSKQNQSADLPVVRYPRTCCYLNGKKIFMKKSKRGAVALKLKKGTNQVKITYKPSICYFVCVIISVVSWIVVFLYFIKNNIRNICK